MPRSSSTASIRSQIRQIVDLLLARVRRQLVEQEITLEATDGGQGSPGGEGLRRGQWRPPLRRAIQNLIEDPLAEGLLTGKFHAGDHVADRCARQ